MLRTGFTLFFCLLGMGAHSALHAAPADLDPTFGGGGIARVNVGTSSDVPTELLAQPDGNFIIVGKSTAQLVNFPYSSAVRFSATGVLDSSFGNQGIVKAIQATNVISIGASAAALQSDGKVILISSTTSGATETDVIIQRLLPSGDPDVTFGTTGSSVVVNVVSPQSDTPMAVAIQPDGKIVIVGYTNQRGVSDFMVLRHLSNGEPDTSFGVNGVVVTPVSAQSSRAHCLCLQSDGKILVGGYSIPSGPTRMTVVRYLADGVLDSAFGQAGVVTLPASALSDSANAIQTDSTGNIYVAGYLGNEAGVFKLSSTGALDSTFGTAGKAVARWETANSVFSALRVSSDGKVIAGGHFRQVVGSVTSYQSGVMRFMPNGTLDSGFGTDGKLQTGEIGTSNSMKTQLVTTSDGGVLFTAPCKVLGISDFAAFKYTASGALDPSFGTQGVMKIGVGNASNGANSLGIQPDGKLISAGYTFKEGIWEMALLRFMPDGTPDLTFGVNGRANSYQNASTSENADAHSVQVASDGSILLTGAMYSSDSPTGINSSLNSAIWKFNSTGTTGTALKKTLSFEKEAAITSVITADGNLFAAGPAGDGAIYDFGILSSSPAGQYLSGIGPEYNKVSISTGTASAYGIGIQSTGRIIVSGYGTEFNQRFPAIVAYDKFLENDPTFGTNGRTRIESAMPISIYDQVIQKDDRIVLAGRMVSDTGNTIIILFRLFPDGQLDTSFGQGGKVTCSLGTTNLFSERMQLQSDGKLVVSGYTHLFKIFVARFHPDGSPDEGFAENGIAFVPVPDVQVKGDGSRVLPANTFIIGGSGRSLVLQPDGKIVLSFTGTHDRERDSDVFLVRLQGGNTAATLSLQDPGNSFLTSGTSTAFFGQPEAGTPSSLTLTLRNSGPNTITGISTSLLGSAMSDYTVQSAPSSTLAPGATTSVTLLFQPSQSGPREATLQINGTGSGFQPFMVSLHGLGPSPVLQISDSSNAVLVSGKSSLSFGHVLKGTTASRIVSLKNTGTAPLNNLQVTLTSASPATFTLGSLPVTSLAPGQSTTLEVMFSPSDAQPHATTVEITAGGAHPSPFTLPITGSGRELSAGETVPGFGINGVANLAGLSGSIRDLVAQDDGKIIVIGNGSGTSGVFLARYQADGTYDPTFGTNGVFRFVPPTATNTSSSRIANAAALQPDGKIVVVGYLNPADAADGLLIFRCLPNGTLDSTFGTNGWTVTDLGSLAIDQAYALIILPDGKIVTGGRRSSSRLTLVRYQANGVLDTSFGTAGIFTSSISALTYGAPVSFAEQSDGKILVATSSSPNQSGTDFQITRHLSNGSLDPTFSADGVVKVLFYDFRNGANISGAFNHLAVQADGKIVASGTAGNFFAVARLLPSGALDTTFGDGGQVLTKFSPLDDLGSAFARAMTLQADGKLVVAGQHTGGLAVARYTSAGILDSTFHGDGRLTAAQGNGREIWAMEVLADGRIAVAGNGGSMFLTTFYTGLKPQLQVEQLSAAAVASGSTITFGTTGLAQPITFPLRIRNTGYAHLSGLGSLFSGLHSADFSAAMATPYLAPGRTLDLNLQFTPTALGTRTGTMTLLSNDDSAGPFTLSLSGDAISSGAAWRQQFFGSTAHSGSAADDFDGDHDGIPNLLEFATFSDPGSSGALPAKVEPGDGTLYYDYQRDRSALTELIFVVEWSDTLNENDWHSENVVETIQSDNGRVQQVRASLPKGAEGRRFVRLRVVRPSP